jgi:D-tyrosyl-tRNA(Tyr) deacylase
MRALLQRVSQANVRVEGEVVGEIGRGLLVLLGLDQGDDTQTAERMLDKLLAYRVFPDDGGRMNYSVTDIAGGVLLVSQFTLSADTRKGLRPSFSSALPPDEARGLYEYTLAALAGRHGDVAAGVFGAEMDVSLTNDGPVTFLLEFQGPSGDR